MSNKASQEVGKKENIGKKKKKQSGPGCKGWKGRSEQSRVSKQEKSGVECKGRERDEQENHE